MIKTKKISRGASAKQKAAPISPPSRESSQELLEGLNESQRAAVLHAEGPLLVVAGAGTGKTTVLTRRIAHLISSKQALPREILALTFTDKAAHAMEERVDRLVPYGFNDVWVSTFHSFGDKILRDHAFEIGMSPDARVLTLPEAIVFLREHFFELKLDHYRPLSDPTRFVEALLATISRAKDEEVSPREFIAWAEESVKRADSDDEKEEARKALEVGRVYEHYEALKAREGYIDFGDQVLLALQVFRKRPSVLRKVQDQFRMILVDEFQDTNYAQFELLKLIAQRHRNLTVVGDDDQSIYKFRGACLSNILGFRKTYPEAREIVLQENYRSTQCILDSAYQLIQHNNPDRLEFQDRVSKRLRSNSGSGLPVRHFLFDTVFAEADFVANAIRQNVDRGAPPGRHAVLVRTNASAEPFLKALNFLGLPWRFSGNAGLYDQPEIQACLAFLRVLDQPEDSTSAYFLAASPLYAVDGEDLALLTQLAERAHRPLLEVFKDAGALDPMLRLPEPSAQTVRRIASDLARYRRLSTRVPTGQLLYQFLEEAGSLKRLAASQDFRSVQEAQNLQKFFEIIKRFGAVARYDRVRTFIEYLEALRLAGEDPASAEGAPDENVVQILTVHAAKGLEFETVFLVGCEQGRFPSVHRSEPIPFPDALIKDILPSGNIHAQEERRLFYVGMTRAKRELILCSARDLGKKKIWKTSQFVLEALDKPRLEEAAPATPPLQALKSFAPPATPPAPSPSVFLMKDGVLSLPATAIEDYLECPLKFKFQRILKIPVRLHHSTVFGIAIHEALRVYHTERKEGRPLALEAVLAVFRKAWRSEGFVSREHEEKRFQEGLQALKIYYDEEEKAAVRPAWVEESFRLAVDGAQIRGRWDRLDMDAESSAIVDYKTGDVEDQKAADQKARKSTQLGLYALAFEQRFRSRPTELVLHFIKKQIRGSAEPTVDKIEEAMEKTRQAVQGIRGQKFEPKSGYHCRWCAYEKICPALNKER